MDRKKLNGPTSPANVANIPITKYNNAPPNESVILFNPFFYYLNIFYTKILKMKI